MPDRISDLEATITSHGLEVIRERVCNFLEVTQEGTSPRTIRFAEDCVVLLRALAAAEARAVRAEAERNEMRVNLLFQTGLASDRLAYIDELKSRAVRAEAVVEAARAAYKVPRPETTRALLRAALDSFDAGQEGKPE